MNIDSVPFFALHKIMSHLMPRGIENINQHHNKIEILLYSRQILH